MSWQLVFEAAAQAEIAKNFSWHEQESYGLGGDFLRMLAAAEEQLTRNPQAFPPSRGRFRRILLRRFPYALHALPAPTGKVAGLIPAIFLVSCQIDETTWHGVLLEMRA